MNTEMIDKVDNSKFNYGRDINFFTNSIDANGLFIPEFTGIILEYKGGQLYAVETEEKRIIDVYDNQFMIL